MPTTRLLSRTVRWAWGSSVIRYLCVGMGLFVLGTALVFLGVKRLGWDVRVSEAVSRAIGATVGFFAHRHITFAAAAEEARLTVVGQGSVYIVLAVVNVLVAPWVLYVAWRLFQPELLLAKAVTEAVMIGETYLVLKTIFLTRGRAR